MPFGSSSIRSVFWSASDCVLPGKFGSSCQSAGSRVGGSWSTWSNSLNVEMTGMDVRKLEREDQAINTLFIRRANVDAVIDEADELVTDNLVAQVISPPCNSRPRAEGNSSRALPVGEAERQRFIRAGPATTLPASVPDTKAGPLLFPLFGSPVNEPSPLPSFGLVPVEPGTGDSRKFGAKLSRCRLRRRSGMMVCRRGSASAHRRGSKS